MICKSCRKLQLKVWIGLPCRWLSQKYRTLTMSMLVAQNIELFTLALSGITIILIPEKGPKYRTVRLNTVHLPTLNIKYINRPPLLDDLDPPLSLFPFDYVCCLFVVSYLNNIIWKRKNLICVQLICANFLCMLIEEDTDGW